MKICLIHNAYGKVSGEEIVVAGIERLLREHGHDVSLLSRSSAELDGSRFGKAKAFFTGVYNFSSKLSLRRLLRRQRPDIVHVHNLFPLISPSVLGECRRAGIPVVMTVHNYRLVCPNGLHMVHGRICEECVGGREYRCAANRCEGSFFKSAGYALRNFVARKMRFFHNNVTMYAALTDFQRRRLIAAGFAADRITVLPNMVAGEPPADSSERGEHVGYVGRISPEKGIPVLLEAARQHPEVRFRAAGAYDRMTHLLDQASSNFGFSGHLGPAELADFYRDSKIVVLPSTCFEGFPTVLVEAMLHGKPVICSRIGGLSEIVEDGVTGLLFEPGNAQDLSAKIAQLWEHPELARQMGRAGRAKALREYGVDRYYERLLSIYRKAIELGPGGPTLHDRMTAPKAQASAVTPLRIIRSAARESQT